MKRNGLCIPIPPIPNYLNHNTTARPFVIFTQIIYFYFWMVKLLFLSLIKIRKLIVWDSLLELWTKRVKEIIYWALGREIFYD